ncbi:DUF262 domain-containing protein [Rhodococcus sp. BH2-1]|uniref:GmrSD restriction endonuclease domain-containing protein n=1 Tax=Prescottella sp. D32 TaxID=3029740 RepID=UPI001E29ED45|nr:DUF262 domain-containing protein [Rhodococcus sp. BH2-1]
MSDSKLLNTEISARAREIRTDGYAMSIGELLSLYKEGDIEIHPEFQRIFRWKDEQRTRLIESILLGIPIPPIFVSQRQDGVWDVIDGVQRLSTIFEFAGEYRNEAGETQPGLVLGEGEYLKSLAGYTYSEDSNPEGVRHFDDALRRDFKRSKIQFSIITKESDQDAKYDLFQRLNSGSVLSQQEARNCLMVMLNRQFFHDIMEMSENPDFKNCVTLTDRKEEAAYRSELVLRFFCLLDYRGPASDLKKDFGEYLTDWMRDATARESRLDRKLFEDTFRLLNNTLGEETFKRYSGTRHLGPFSISGFEFISCGVAATLEVWMNHPDDLMDKIRSVWSSPELKDNSGAGISPRQRVPRFANFSRDFFRS